ncbi:MAG: DUF2851 family protein [Prevotellaceae bacterium]|jgi:hypothetical protein|nr:DUF2851 family protein [Prevotellaceae bacterium]
MGEDFLHFVWKFGLLDKNGLKTAAGENVEIISPGTHNKDSGPDFTGAKIKIGEVLWAGNVEIHVKASDWLLHGHQNDKSYDSVILHAVAINDVEITRMNTETIPVITINYPKSIEQKYRELADSSFDIPCKLYLPKITEVKIKHWLTRMAAERLEYKAEYIAELLKQTQSDFDRVLRRLLFRYFGFKVNALPFELLAQNIPAVAKKYHASLPTTEALLFGQAGFLDDELAEDDYYNALKREYLFLKAKHGLNPMNKSLWKFARLRPYNFPTLRIAQMAALLHKCDDLFDAVLNADDVREHIAVFEDVRASEYWDTRYLFGKTVEKPLPKRIGRTAAELIALNVTVPFMFAYARSKGDENLRERALNLLDKFKPESNSTIRNWAEAGIKAGNAAESQALLHLYAEYCSPRKCLQCAIGKIVVGDKQ